MKKFEYTEDFGKNKKGDVIDYDDKTYCEAQHPLVMRKILKVINTNRYAEIKALTKDEQIVKIKELGGDDTKIPKYEDGRIKLIIELEDK